VRRKGTRIILLLPLLLLLFTLCPPATAQQTGKVYRVGRLSGGQTNSTFSIDAIRRELRGLGYVEGKNIIFELRNAENKSARLPALVDDLLRLKVDLIIAGGPNDGLAAKKATKTIPIVFTDSPTDPVAYGLVDSVARPGGNVTGFYSMADVLAGKRLEMLKESLPKLSHVAILRYSESPTDERQWTESRRVAQQLGLQIYPMEIDNTHDYESAFKTAVKTGSTAVAVVRHRLSETPAYRKAIIDLAAKYRLPTIYISERFCRERRIVVLRGG